MVQAGQRQRPAEAEPLGVGVDPDDVDLPDVPVSPSSARCTLVQWKPRSSALALGQEEARGVEPRLTHPAGEVGTRHAALLGVVGEGAGVDVEPGVLVTAGLERADRHVRRG